MASSTHVIVKFNHFPELIRSIPAKIDSVVESHAHGLESGIKGGIVDKGIVDTGAYLNSWDVEKESEGVWVAYSDKEYGPYQEFGTARGLPARPHVVPAAEAERGPFEADLRNVIERG